MKNIVLLLFLTPFLLANRCNVDDGSLCDNETLRETQNNLFTIENPQEIYEVGDTLWINSELERNFSLESITRTVDLFDYGELSFHFNFDKTSVFDSSTYLCVNDETIEIINGVASARCNGLIYEKTETGFITRFGIKLLEVGNFSLLIKEIQSQNCITEDISIRTSFNNDAEMITFEVQ